MYVQNLIIELIIEHRGEKYNKLSKKSDEHLKDLVKDHNEKVKKNQEEKKNPFQ